jgi:cytochrome c-type biogenesis protein CcmH/NrfG
MVIVFVVGFTFLGVGSGGLDLQSLVQDVFGSKGGGGTSVSKAQAATRKHPNDPQAWKNLATALQAKGRIDEAIVAFEKYTTLRPNDVGQLQTLAQLEGTQATSALQTAQIAAADQGAASAGSTFGNSQLSGSDPIQGAVSSRASSQATSAFAAYKTDSERFLQTLKSLAKLQHDSFSYTRLGQAAAQFGNTALAIASYRTALRLEKDPRVKAQIRAQLRSLHLGH